MYRPLTSAGGITQAQVLYAAPARVNQIASAISRLLQDFVVTFLAVASISTITLITLVLIVTTVAHSPLLGETITPTEGDDVWSRWSQSPEISVGDSPALEDIAYLESDLNHAALPMSE